MPHGGKPTRNKTNKKAAHKILETKVESNVNENIIKEAKSVPVMKNKSKCK